MSEKATEKLKIGGTNSDYGILEEYSTAIFSEISCVARSFGFTYEESRANAELIVKCVNGYEALEAENKLLREGLHKLDNRLRKIDDCFNEYCTRRKDKGASIAKNRTWNNLVFSFDEVKSLLKNVAALKGESL
jgi:argonaute-like protein implicated in RNA metabolism and viral defense